MGAVCGPVLCTGPSPMPGPDECRCTGTHRPAPMRRCAAETGAVKSSLCPKESQRDCGGGRGAELGREGNRDVDKGPSEMVAFGLRPDRAEAGWTGRGRRPEQLLRGGRRLPGRKQTGAGGKAPPSTGTPPKVAVSHPPENDRPGSSGGRRVPSPIFLVSLQIWRLWGGQRTGRRSVGFPGPSPSPFRGAGDLGYGAPSWSSPHLSGAVHCSSRRLGC